MIERNPLAIECEDRIDGVILKNGQIKGGGGKQWLETVGNSRRIEL